MLKVTRNTVRQAVQELKEFKGSNMFNVVNKDSYVVYSYGPHWPMFIFKQGVWYENKDKYSVTTSIQHGKCPPWADTIKLSCQEMKDLLSRRD